MNDFVKLIEEIKTKNNIPSDLQLSVFLGISINMAYRIAKGMSVPSDETCIKIARVTGYDPAYVIALAHKSGSKRREVTKVWDHILSAVPKGMAAAFFVTAAILLMNPGESAASQMARTALQEGVGTIYYQTLFITSGDGSAPL